MLNVISRNLGKGLFALAILVMGAGSAVMLIPATSADAQTPEEPVTATDWIDEALADLVANGAITSETAQVVEEALRAARPANLRDRHAGSDRGALETVAEVIGIDLADLVAAIREGQAIASIAEDAGISADTVIDALKADLDTRLTAAVAEGRIDADKADALRAAGAERITALVTGEASALGGFPKRGFERGFKRHFGGDSERPASRDSAQSQTRWQA